MVWSGNYGRSSHEERVSKTASFIGSSRVLPQRFRIDYNEIKACLCAVSEDDEVDDFTSTSTKPDRYIRNNGYAVDLRDLLFDETD